MRAYLAVPKKEIKGGILALHAWWGLNNFLKTFCDRLAAQGYLVHAPDLYRGEVANTIPEAEKLRGKLKREVAAREILEALAQLQNHPSTI
jgi:carboxymethylenebutenolidase